MISTFELFQLFSDSESARVYLESQRWPTGVSCPACSEARRLAIRNDGMYRCNACLLDFSVKTGTILERSKVPLNKWLYAMHLIAITPTKFTSMRFATQIGVTDASAQFIIRRLRTACGAIPFKVLDETDLAEPLAVLDAIAACVLVYRPANKGRALSTAVTKAEKARTGKTNRAP